MNSLLRRCLLPCLLPLALLASDVREQIVVVVNNHIITRRTLQQAFEQESAALYRQFSGAELDTKLKDAKAKALQSLIDHFLIEDRAVEMKVNPPTDASIIENMKKQSGLTSDAELEKAVKAQLGISLADFVKQQRRDVAKYEVLGYEVRGKIAVEEQELRAYYESHKNDYRQPSRFRIRELVLPKGVTTEEQMAAMAKLQAIQAAIKQGQPFEELVKTHSTSPSKSTQGDLGWLNKGIIRDTLENAALALKPMQVSEPIITDKDIYLVQLLAVEQEGAKPFEEVRSEILEKVRGPKESHAIENYLQTLRVKAHIRYVVPKETLLRG